MCSKTAVSSRTIPNLPLTRDITARTYIIIIIIVKAFIVSVIKTAPLIVLRHFVLRCPRI